MVRPVDNSSRNSVIDDGTFDMTGDAAATADTPVSQPFAQQQPLNAPQQFSMPPLSRLPIPSLPSLPEYIRMRAESIMTSGLTEMDRSYYAAVPGRPELGTWTEGSSTGVWDTAMALITELTLGKASFETASQMVRYLVSQQLADGGWSDSPGDIKSSISATVICYAALNEFQSQMWTEAVQRQDTTYLTSSTIAQAKALTFVQTQGFANMNEAAGKANFVCLLYYAQVFPDAAAFVEEVWRYFKTIGLDWHHLPEPESLERWCSENGIYQVFPEVIACLVVLLAPEDVKGTGVYAKYCKKLLDDQDSNGMWCDVTSISNLCLIALHRAGYGADYSALSRGLDAVRALRRQGSDGIQAYTYDSSTWNNCLYIETRLRIDIEALADPHVLSGIRYLLACQEPDGSFQYVLGADGDGECDTTGFILALLCRVQKLLKDAPYLLPTETRTELLKKIYDAMILARNNLLQMQNDNGGFSTFARTDQDKSPGAMAFTPGTDLISEANVITLTDESIADVTAHALMGLGAMGQTSENSPAVARAVAWLRKDFVPGAGWWGRWGCGYLYGTCETLRALNAVGVKMDRDPLVNSAVQLLLSHQNSDGGWGENGHASDDPNENPALVAMTGPSNASFTALVIMTLLDLGFPADHPVISKGMSYLLNNYTPAVNVTGDAAWRQSHLTLQQQEMALWHDNTPNADFYPTIWYQKELTFGDLVPLAALARYLGKPSP
jgi:prenyltransferase beta subunit